MPAPATQHEFRIEVQTSYLPEQSRPDDSCYSFAYTVRITNQGRVAAQLISRHWFIRDDDGRMVEVKGLGVVGHQPLLKPGEQFEYTSGSQLATPTGEMRGSYFFVSEHGERFDVEIPQFALSMPRTLH